MALDPSDPPWVRFAYCVAHLSDLTPRQAAREFACTQEELLEIYAGRLVPGHDTRLRIQNFGRARGIEIGILEWLAARSQILAELASPRPAQAPATKKTRTKRTK